MPRHSGDVVVSNDDNILGRLSLLIFDVDFCFVSKSGISASLVGVFFNKGLLVHLNFQNEVLVG